MHTDEDADGDKHELGDEDGDADVDEDGEGDEDGDGDVDDVHADEATPGKHYAPQSKQWMLMCGLWRPPATSRQA